MSQHYYSRIPESLSQPKEITAHVCGRDFTFQTDSGVFSKYQFDFGSKVLVESFLSHSLQAMEVDILELGSGYGPIAIILGECLAHSYITGVEINERAVALARKNALNRGLTRVDFLEGDASQDLGQARYDYVLTNPPIRAGKAVIQAFVQTAYQSLKPGGSLWLVIQKKQGAPSMKQYMMDLFGHVDRVALEKGYWVLKAEKV